MSSTRLSLLSGNAGLSMTAKSVLLNGAEAGTLAD
jgi:hypothetical protein